MENNIIKVPEGFKAELMEDGNILLVKIEEELPKTWEECYKKLDRNNSYCITTDSRIFTSDTNNCPRPTIKNILPSKSIAKAMLALNQLLVCREVYRDGWVPDWENEKQDKYCIQYRFNKVDTVTFCSVSFLLSFQTAEIRDKFLENFRDLIEETKELLW